MMRYEKPIVNVIDLQIKENIAATVDGTVYKATGSGVSSNVMSLALSQSTTGIASADSDGLVSES